MQTKTLKNCPYIVSLEELDLNPFLKEDLEPNWRKMFEERLEKTIAYKIVYKIGKIKVVGFIVLPKTGEDLPCIIHLRGGSRDFGKITEEKLIYQQTFFASNGYVVISTQYPGVDGGDGEDDWGGSDSMASIKKLKTILDYIPQADTKRIGVKGHSRGGTMAYMLLREVKWLKAAVIGGAPTDEFKAGKEREGWRRHQISLYGKSKEELHKRSAIKWVNELPENVPILLVHGSADWRVTADHSINMSKAMYEHKIPHRFILFEGADHGISEHKKENKNQALNWFNTYLAKDRKLPNIKLHGE
jgi:dipeptidyl aminopeptidase/acylaminoacyl peptidase